VHVHELEQITTATTTTTTSSSYSSSSFSFSFFLLLLLLFLEALQLQRSFGSLNEFLQFDTVFDAVLPVCYFHPCYIAFYIILPSIFWSS
jgi:hypothetical protein